MPTSFMGIGTQYYGKALILPARKRHMLAWLWEGQYTDETYVVTEWVTVLGVPLFPLGSYRVRLVDYEYKRSATIRQRWRYEARRVPLYWPQVRWGYALTLSVGIALFWLSLQ